MQPCIVMIAVKVIFTASITLHNSSFFLVVGIIHFQYGSFIVKLSFGISHFMTKNEVGKGKTERRCEVGMFASLKNSDVETDRTPVRVLPSEGSGEWLGQEAGLPLGGCGVLIKEARGSLSPRPSSTQDTVGRQPSCAQNQEPGGPSPTPRTCSFQKCGEGSFCCSQAAHSVVFLFQQQNELRQEERLQARDPFLGTGVTRSVAGLAGGVSAGRSRRAPGAPGAPLLPEVTGLCFFTPRTPTSSAVKWAMALSPSAHRE